MSEEAYFLESERLGFRRWREADLPLAIALWGDAEVSRYLGGDTSPEGAEARMRLEMARQQRLGVQYWPMFERATGEHVGCSGLRPFYRDESVYELGVHVGRPFWSNRMGEEAARAVMRYGFGTLDLPVLVAGHHRENVSSEKLLARLGFVFTQDDVWGPQEMPVRFYRLERSRFVLPV